MTTYYTEGGGSRIYIGLGLWASAPPRTGTSTTIIPDQTWGSLGTPIALASRESLSDASSAVQRQANVSAFNEPCRVVLGTDRIGGQLLNGVTTASGTLLLTVGWCRGPVSAINSVTMNNAALPAGVTVTSYTGTLSQTVNAKLVAAFALIGITHSYAFPGIAYSVFEIDTSTDIGDFHAIIDGVKPYDIRNGAHVLGTPSTWTFSKNPALLLANVISDATYGLGATMDWSGSVAAFDACDAITTGEAKRQIGYTLDRRMSASQICEILRAHAGCFIVRSAGKFKLVPDAVASSSATYAKSTSTLVEKSVQWQLAGLQQQPNVVEVAYTDTAVVPWRTAVAVYPANAVPPAGEELRLTRIDLPGCQRYSQAMREVIERRNHARLEPLTISVDTYAESVATEPGDVYTINDGGAFTGTLLRCLNRSMRRKGRFTLVGKKYDPATYSSAADAAPTYVNTNLPDPSNPPTVGPVTLTEQVVTNASGALPLSRILATWPAVTTFPFLSGYRVTVIDPFGVIMDTSDVTTNAYSSPPLNAFATYTVRVYARSSVAVSASASIATITLISSGLGALAAVWSYAISRADIGSWTLGDKVEAFTLWPGDTVVRLRTISPNVETTVYPGANQSTPGLATQILDDAPIVVSPISVNSVGTYGRTAALSPNYTMATSRTAIFALLNVSRWAALYGAALEISVFVNDIYWAIAPATFATGIYARVRVQSKYNGSTFTQWQIEFDGASIAALMPTLTDNFQVTTLTTGPLTVNLTALLGRHYIVCNLPQVTPVSSASANATSTNLTISEVSDNTVQINAFDNAGGRVAVVVAVSITGVPA